MILTSIYNRSLTREFILLYVFCLFSNISSVNIYYLTNRKKVQNKIKDGARENNHRSLGDVWLLISKTS